VRREKTTDYYELNAYHIMWLFVFFDLPVVTKQQRKQATKFRVNLERDGYQMMQYSVYVRHCASMRIMETHIRRLKTLIPEEGLVSVLKVTDKQYSEITNFYGKVLKIRNENPKQLEIF
jgi:CRISPR-associated protein Cas2